MSATPAGAVSRPGPGNRYRLQRALTERRFGQFLHFNMGTFTDQEWADPDQDPKTFAPTALDCGQWADAAKAAGMTFALLVAKHHDGFCLWPSKLNTHNVAYSSYPRDVVRQYVDAYRARDVTPALYFSIWDRTTTVAPPVTPAMIDYVKGQLTELLTWYGPIPLLVFDGWAWSFGHGAAPGGVPFGEIRAHVTALQPDCLVMDLTGLSTAWQSDLTFYEEAKGGIFCPPGNTVAATQSESISSAGWFWHPSTPSTLLSAEQIATGHLDVLQPRYCTFILNTPPNRQGLLDSEVVSVLQEAGGLWRPSSRPPLPAQPDVLRYPVTATSATATSGNPTLAIDGISDFGWNGEATQTLWQSDPGLPQAITLDLGHLYQGIDHLTYLPRQDTTTPYTFSGFITDGNITGYRVAVSSDGARFHEVAHGTWTADHTLKQAYFSPTLARYVRLEATSAAGDVGAIASEIDTGGLNRSPVPEISPYKPGMPPVGLHDREDLFFSVSFSCVYDGKLTSGKISSRSWPRFEGFAAIAGRGIAREGSASGELPLLPGGAGLEWRHSCWPAGGKAGKHRGRARNPGRRDGLCALCDYFAVRYVPNCDAGECAKSEHPRASA